MKSQILILSLAATTSFVRPAFADQQVEQLQATQQQSIEQQQQASAQSDAERRAARHRKRNAIIGAIAGGIIGAIAGHEIGHSRDRGPDQGNYDPNNGYDQGQYGPGYDQPGYQPGYDPRDGQGGWQQPGDDQRWQDGRQQPPRRVTCYAEDRRGRTYQADAFDPRLASARAVRRCQQVAGSCRTLPTRECPVR